MDEINHTAEDVAKEIDDASHDSLKDSWWDSHVRKWIHDHADLLKMVADVLTWIATAIVIVVLIVGTGGIGLAMLLTAGALLIHTMLAANGDGSWVDVAFDVVALATMGAGKAFTSAAEAARTAQLLEVAPGAADAAFSSTAVLGRLFVAGEDGIQVVDGAIMNVSEAGEAFTKAFNAVATREMPEMNALIKLGFGDSANVTNDLLRIGSEFGDGPLVQQGLQLAGTATTAFRVGTLVDATGKIVNDANVGIFHWDGCSPG